MSILVFYIYHADAYQVICEQSCMTQEQEKT